MTLRLVLTRHAKSSWDAPAEDDHARPLNDRGRTSADALGVWLGDNGYVPDLVLSSDALRTRETWMRLATGLAAQPEIVWTPDLYLAGPGTMLQVLRRVQSAATVLMLGHNPGIAQFAAALVADPPPHPRFADYPTGATLVAGFDLPRWEALRPGTGQSIDFVVPRDLTG